MNKLFLLLLMLGFLTEIHSADPSISASISPSEVVVGSRHIWEVTFLVDADTIQPGTVVEVLTFPELKEISFFNVSASTSNGVSISGFGLETVGNPAGVDHPVWDNDNARVLISYKINGQIPPGETITVTLGSSFTKPKMHNYAGTDEFRALFKKPNDEYIEITNTLDVVVKSFPARNLLAFIPSVVETNETSNYLRVSFTDNFLNRNETFIGTLVVDCGEKSNLNNATIQIVASDKGSKEIPVIFDEEGFCQCELEVTESNSQLFDENVVYKTNFAWVQDNPPYRIFWGDLHSHSGLGADGSGVMSFEYARYTTGLDFFAAAEHAHTLGNDWSSLNDKEWAYLKQQTTDFYDEGRFIPILSYENNYGGDKGGHHNVYHDWDETESIESIERIPTILAPDVNDLFDLLDQAPSTFRSLCFPHFLYVGNITAQDQLNPPYTTFGEPYANEKYRTTYELFSNHSQSEYYNPNHQLNNRLTYWYAQDALAAGEKLGFIASSDNHTAKPGQNGDGLAAAVIPSLNRKNIFDALESRNTYATVGDRIIIEFNERESPMGSDILLEPGQIPLFNIFVHGTGPLEKVELVKWDFVNGVYNGVHPTFNTIKIYDNLPDSTLSITETFADDGFVANSVYYLRVKQNEDIFITNLEEYKESWAWSSPIWVSDTLITTSLLENTIELSNLHPNPIKEGERLKLDLKSTKLYPNARISVFNQQGQIVETFYHTIMPNRQTIDVPTEGLNCGNYFVSVTSNDKRLAIKPFIIVH